MKMQFIFYLKYSLIILAAAVFGGCHDDPTPESSYTPEPGQETSGRMVLVYQVANNDLSTDADKDYAEMLQGASDIGSGNHFLVYRHTKTTSPMLIEITASGVDTLYTYSTDVSSVDINRMVEVIDDAKTYSGSADHGLILWSHGSGWVQDGMTQTDIKRSFGVDGSKRMNITDLATALSTAGGFDWIYFDCCYMMSVETLYELRDCTDFFVGSVTELQSPGMPYHLNMKYFFADGEADIVGAANSTYEYYLDYIENLKLTAPIEYPYNNYCTMSVVKAAALEDLARVTRDIYAKAPSSIPEGFSAQQFSNYSSATTCRYFDFGQYAQAMASGDDISAFDAALDEAVVYKAATPMLRNLPILYHSGLSTYILRESSYATKSNYNTLSWYADVASSLTF